MSEKAIDFAVTVYKVLDFCRGKIAGNLLSSEQLFADVDHI